MRCRNMAIECWPSLMVVVVADRHELEKDFPESPEWFTYRIRWLLETGGTLNEYDRKKLAEYLRNGRLKPERDKTIPPSNAHEIAIAKHMFRRFREFGKGNYEAAAKQTAIDLDITAGTAKKYYGTHLDHARSIVAREDMIAAIDHLIEELGQDEAILKVASDIGMDEWEVRMHYTGWKMTFPHKPLDYYEPFL